VLLSAAKRTGKPVRREARKRKEKQESNLISFLFLPFFVSFVPAFVLFVPCFLLYYFSCFSFSSWRLRESCPDLLLSPLPFSADRHLCGKFSCCFSASH